MKHFFLCVPYNILNYLIALLNEIFIFVCISNVFLLFYWTIKHVVQASYQLEIFSFILALFMCNIYMVGFGTDKVALVLNNICACVSLKNEGTLCWKQHMIIAWLLIFTRMERFLKPNTLLVLLYLSQLALELLRMYFFHSFATTQDNSPSLAKRVKKSDAREIESFYQQYYENYVRALDKGEQADR